LETSNSFRKIIFYSPIVLFFVFFHIKFEYHEIYQKLFSIKIFLNYAIVIFLLISSILFAYLSRYYFKSSAYFQGAIYTNITALFILPILFLSICQQKNYMYELYLSGLNLTISICFIFFCAAFFIKNNQNKIINFNSDDCYLVSFFVLTFAYYIYHSYLIGIIIEWYNSRPSLINQFPVTYLFVDNDKIVIDFLLSVCIFIFVLTKIMNKNIAENKILILNNARVERLKCIYVFVLSIMAIITFCIHMYCSKKILPYNFNIQVYTLANVGSFNKASDLIKKVLVVKPDDKKAQLNYAMTLFIKNEFKLALNVYNRIIKVDPDNEIAHTQAGIIYLNQNKIEKAIRHFEKVLKKNSRSIIAHEKMGYIRYVQGKIFESRYHFEKVRELNPNSAKSYLNLAIAASFSGQVDQSIKLLKDSLFIEPLCVEAHDNLGAALVSRGNIEEAINHFYIALQLNPEYKQSQNNLESITKGIFNLAKKFEDNHKYDKAIEMYTKLSKFRPDWSAYMFFNIGRIYSKLSKAGQSICWLKKAVRINFDLWEVFEKDRAYSYIQQHAHFKSVLLKKDPELLICDKAIE